MIISHARGWLASMADWRWTLRSDVRQRFNLRDGNTATVRLAPSGTQARNVPTPADEPEATRFAPHEVKQSVFDFHVGSGNTRDNLKLGIYRFEGAYGDMWAPNPPTVVVAQ
jgi:hypothetical protein